MLLNTRISQEFSDKYILYILQEAVIYSCVAFYALLCVCAILNISTLMRLYKTPSRHASLVIPIYCILTHIKLYVFPQNCAMLTRKFYIEKTKIIYRSTAFVCFILLRLAIRGSFNRWN